MTLGWTTHSLGEFISVKHGWPFPAEDFLDEGDYVVLTPGNFSEGGGIKLRGKKDKHFSSEFPSQYLLSRDDILVVMTDLIQTAPLLGGALIVPEDDRYLHNQRLGLVLTEGKREIDRGFLYYLLNSPDYKAQVRASATGATVRHTAPSRIESCKVRVPNDAKQQRAIAEILEWHDVAIATAHTQIALLEEAARLIYTEWFVRRQVPHSVTNGIPDEWVQGFVSDFVEVLSGGTPSTKTAMYWEGDIPFFTPADATASCYVVDTEKHLSEAGLTSCNSALFPKGTVFVTARGTVGKLALAQKPMAMNQSCYALQTKDRSSQFFLYCAMQAVVAHLKQAASGGVFDAIVVDTFRRTPMIWPPREVINRFHAVVEPIFTQIETLLLQIDQLRQARDLLLPRLISGQLRL